MLCNAAIAPAAMLTPERSAYHAGHAEIGFVELPELNKLINNGLLLRNAVELWDEAGIVDHTRYVEIRGQTQEEGKCQVENPVCM